MKAKILIFSIVFIGFSVKYSWGQTLQDTIEFKKTALAYISSWGQGNSDKMQKSLHPMVYKQNTKGEVLDAKKLTDLTSQGYGVHSAQFFTNIEILDIEKGDHGDFLIAAVKVVSDAFIDYLTITKTYGQFLITHALWEYKEVKGIGKNKDIMPVVNNYYRALVSKNYKKLASNVSESFCSGQGKCYFVVENASLDWFKEYLKEYSSPFSKNENIEIEILDSYNGILALAKAKQGNLVEYFHLVNSGTWKIANTSRNYYMPLKEIYLSTTKIGSKAEINDSIANFDTRLHYNGDIKYYKLENIENKEKCDNRYFEIIKDNLYLRKNADEIEGWPLHIRIKAESTFGDIIFQDFVLDKGELMVKGNQNTK